MTQEKRKSNRFSFLYGGRDEEHGHALMNQQEQDTHDTHNDYENAHAPSKKKRNVGATAVGAGILFAFVVFFGCSGERAAVPEYSAPSAANTKTSPSVADFEKLLFKSETADMTLIDQELNIDGKAEILRKFAYSVDFSEGREQQYHDRHLQFNIQLPGSATEAPSVSAMPSDMPSISDMPSVSNAPTSTPSSSPSGTPSLTPTMPPSTSAPSSTPTNTAAPTFSMAPTSSPTVDDRVHAAVYMIFWGYRGFACESPESDMIATCGEESTMTILDVPNEDHNCVVDETAGNSSIVCAPQRDSYVFVRCETQGYNPEQLMLEVTLQENSLFCDGCIGGDCVNEGVALQRAFVFTLCDGALYENHNNCTGTTKFDNQGHPYCETRTGCNFGLGEPGCTAPLDPVVVTAVGILKPNTGYICIETLGRPTQRPSSAPSSMPSVSPTAQPSSKPSASPSTLNSPQPSSQPSMFPSLSMLPTESSAISEEPTTEV